MQFFSINNERTYSQEVILGSIVDFVQQILKALSAWNCAILSMAFLCPLNCLPFSKLLIYCVFLLAEAVIHFIKAGF